jgi:hypothetical protein
VKKNKKPKPAWVLKIISVFFEPLYLLKGEEKQKTQVSFLLAWVLISL